MSINAMDKMQNGLVVAPFMMTLTHAQITYARVSCCTGRRTLTRCGAVELYDLVAADEVTFIACASSSKCRYAL